MRREWSPEDLIACWTLVGSATEHPAGQFQRPSLVISVIVIKVFNDAEQEVRQARTRRVHG